MDSISEKWKHLMENIYSPQSFLDFGFYYLIAASLQRRVWVAGQYNLYPSQYTILVAEPGIGKGLVIRTVSELLSFHKKESIVSEIKNADPELVAAIHEAERAASNQGTVYKSKFEERLLFPIASDATTYEALVQYTAKSIRRVPYMKWNEELQKNVSASYTHSSIAFCLGEISSLFKKHSEDTVNFLVTAFDGEDYRYSTKSQGTDFVKSPCINLFGGTQPDFIRRIFSEAIISDGFASRSMFVVADENRFEQTLRLPELNANQRQAKFDILNYIKKLSTLYGPITMTEAVWEYAEGLLKDDRKNKVNISPKLKSYYSRKNIHLLKLAMAIHFGDSLVMELTVEDISRAMIALNSIESKMHTALEFDGKNPLSKIAKKIEEFLIKNGPKSFQEIFAMFFNDCNMQQLQDIRDYLVYTKKVVLDDAKWHSIAEIEMRKRIVIDSGIKIETQQLTQEALDRLQQQQTKQQM